MPSGGGLIAVVPSGRDAPPLSEFTNRLAAAISAHDPALLLNNRNIDDHCAKDRVTEYLTEQAASNRYVVCECDNSASDWTTQCLRHAACILFAGSAEGESSFSQIEQEISGRETAKTARRKELVLLHRQRRPYSDTLRWLSARQVDLHHHVALDSSEDFERLARILTCRGVGLVLSGGGARGFAHIGVIRALREHGITIDLIGGCSMGSCIGAQCALGWDFQTMLKVNREGWVRLHPLRDYTIPIVSLFTGRRLVRAFTMMFGDTQIEDLPINYFCVSSDLVRGELVVHREGLLRKYVRASSSAPGMLPPVPDRGSLLVDGGVLNNMPADVMRELYGGTVMAIDVNPYGYSGLALSSDYGQSLSARQILWSRLNPLARKLLVPNIHAILERMTMLGGVRQAGNLRDVGVDFHIHPPTDEFGLLEMDKIETIADIGYRFASVQIEAWKK